MLFEYEHLRGEHYPIKRGHPSDAGVDVRWVPDPPNNPTPRVLKPGCSSMFGTGIAVNVPHGYMLQVMNKSSIAVKRSLVVGACVVDPGYTGEIFVNLHNIGSEEQAIMPYDKLAQLVAVRVEHPSFTLNNIEDWTRLNISARGDGALGSTGG